MENFASQTFLAPQPSTDGDGTWIMKRNMNPQAQMPLIDSVGDGGKFVGAILADPDKYIGKTICAATKLYSLTEQADALAKSSGKNIVYRQVSDDELAQSLPAPAVSIFVDYLNYINEFGYFGPKTGELVEWAAAQARGNLSTLEEYFERHPYTLA